MYAALAVSPREGILLVVVVLGPNHLDKTCYVVLHRPVQGVREFEGPPIYSSPVSPMDEVSVPRPQPQPYILDRLINRFSSL